MTRIFNEKFEYLKKIGEGTYGAVYLASPLEDSIKPENEKRKYAIKRISSKIDGEGIDFTYLKEIRILKEIHSENVIKICDTFYDTQNAYIVYEYMNTDLRFLIDNVKLSEPMIKLIAYQILNGLKVIHEKGILHRDMKPENILINFKGEVKLADFGMARNISTPERGMTRNIVTKMYRSPELFFGANYYSSSVDIWSLGCIIGEMILRDRLFQGNNDIEIIQRIFSLLGVPDENEWKFVNELNSYKKFKNGDIITVKNKFHFISDDFVNLLENMLVNNPNKRISATESLNHMCFKEMSSIEELSALIIDLKSKN